jgi:YVTN family beta-propeller protein
VTRIYPATNALVATVRVGVAPTWLARAADGTLLVPNNGDNTVSRVDPASNSVIETVRVGPGPVVIRPAFGDLWLTHLRGATVWRFHVG